MYIMAGAHGHGTEDDSAVVKVYQTLSGISLPEKVTVRKAPAKNPARKAVAKRGGKKSRSAK
jgi:hypothetical protein